MAKKLWYRELLASEKWQWMRKRRFREANYTCSLCMQFSVVLCLHHLNYLHVGRERKKDLVVVCKKCHTLCHFTKTWKLKTNKLEHRYNFLKNHFRKLAKKE